MRKLNSEKTTKKEGGEGVKTIYLFLPGTMAASTLDSIVQKLAGLGVMELMDAEHVLGTTAEVWLGDACLVAIWVDDEDRLSPLTKMVRLAELVRQSDAHIPIVFNYPAGLTSPVLSHLQSLTVKTPNGHGVDDFVRAIGALLAQESARVPV